MLVVVYRPVIWFSVIALIYLIIMSQLWHAGASIKQDYSYV